MRAFPNYLICLLGLGFTGGGLLFAIVDCCQGTSTWADLALGVTTVLVIASGISVGFHRYLTHRAFEFTRAGAILAKPLYLWFGSLAWQSSPLWWAAVHTKHHEDPDGHADPHSPVPPRPGFFRRVGQFLWAHMLWVPHTFPDIERFCRLHKVTALERLFDRWYTLVGPASGCVVAYLLGGPSGIGWYLAGVFVAWHLTQAINSVTHLGDLVGYAYLRAKDHSTNLWMLALLTMGEALHRNHHAFPRSARFAHRWWERIVDLGYLQIRLLKLLGLVYTLTLPTPEQLQAKLA